MRILCPIHDASEVVQLSPDYEVHQHDTYCRSAVVVHFEWEGESLDRYVLSEAFVAKHKVIGGRQPLPECYPDWYRLVKIDCRRCFEGRGGTEFKNSGILLEQ